MDGYAGLDAAWLKFRVEGMLKSRRSGGIGELICINLGAYIAKAIELGRNPKALDGLKQKLAAERGSCLLFNTPLLVEKLEGLYRCMWDDYKADPSQTRPEQPGRVP